MEIYKVIGSVYVTGVTDESTRKLLGVPETRYGTGTAEADVVQSLLTEWNVKREICGMVFDTTSRNSGAEIGACKCLEDWLGTPILWLACRHHVQELHLKRVVQGATGQTKEPGMALFKRRLSGTPSRLTTATSTSSTLVLCLRRCRKRVGQCWPGH